MHAKAKLNCEEYKSQWNPLKMTICLFIPKGQYKMCTRSIITERRKGSKLISYYHALKITKKYSPFAFLAKISSKQRINNSWFDEKKLVRVMYVIFHLYAFIHNAMCIIEWISYRNIAGICWKKFQRLNPLSKGGKHSREEFDTSSKLWHGEQALKLNIPWIWMSDIAWRGNDRNILMRPKTENILYLIWNHWFIEILENVLPIGSIVRRSMECPRKFWKEWA